MGLVALVVSGWFGGARAKLGGILLAMLLVADLALISRAWVVMVNWKQKYETNSIIEFLKERAYEHRVAIFPADRFVDMRRLPREAPKMIEQYNYFTSLYGQEWTQHLFLYHNIQTLDIIQEPRMATEKAAYESVMYFAPLRRWQLTNTRYLIGPMPASIAERQTLDQCAEYPGDIVRCPRIETRWIHAPPDRTASRRAPPESGCSSPTAGRYAVADRAEPSRLCNASTHTTLPRVCG